MNVDALNDLLDRAAWTEPFFDEFEKLAVRFVPRAPIGTGGMNELSRAGATALEKAIRDGKRIRSASLPGTHRMRSWRPKPSDMFHAPAGGRPLSKAAFLNDLNKLAAAGVALRAVTRPALRLGKQLASRQRVALIRGSRARALRRVPNANAVVQPGSRAARRPRGLERLRNASGPAPQAPGAVRRPPAAAEPAVREARKPRGIERLQEARKSGPAPQAPGAVRRPPAAAPGTLPRVPAGRAQAGRRSLLDSPSRRPAPKPAPTPAPTRTPTPTPAPAPKPVPAPGPTTPLESLPFVRPKAPVRKPTGADRLQARMANSPKPPGAAKATGTPNYSQAPGQRVQSTPMASVNKVTHPDPARLPKVVRTQPPARPPNNPGASKAHVGKAAPKAEPDVYYAKPGTEGTLPTVAKPPAKAAPASAKAAPTPAKAAQGGAKPATKPVEAPAKQPAAQTGRGADLSKGLPDDINKVDWNTATWGDKPVDIEKLKAGLRDSGARGWSIQGNTRRAAIKSAEAHNKRLKAQQVMRAASGDADAAAQYQAGGFSPMQKGVALVGSGAAAGLALPAVLSRKPRRDGESMEYP
jgi:hypothetical protein